MAAPWSAQWADRDTEKLRRMWDEGLSARTIADELDTTRNAVLGKVHRLGLAAHKSTEFKPGPPRPRKKRHAVSPAPAPAPAPDVAVATPVVPEPPKYRRLTLMQLQEHHCRWPVEDAPFRFCGAYRKSGEPYCRYHMDRAFHRPRKS